MEPQDTTGVAAPFQQQPSSRILIVEDDLFIRRMNVEALLRRGYEVDGAEDGSVAWDALQDIRYDLMVTDNDMPNLCGIDLVKKLRALGVTLPVILASGMTQKNSDRLASLDLAAMLPKPYTTSKLVQVVQSVLHAARVAHGQPEPLPV